MDHLRAIDNRRLIKGPMARLARTLMARVDQALKEILELRIGDYRVYFEVKEHPARVVRIVAVGLKDRDRVVVGGVEVKLR